MNFGRKDMMIQPPANSLRNSGAQDPPVQGDEEEAPNLAWRGLAIVAIPQVYKWLKNLTFCLSLCSSDIQTSK